IGVARAPVVGSGWAPAWMASVAKPGVRSVMAGPRAAGAFKAPGGPGVSDAGRASRQGATATRWLNGKKACRHSAGIRRRQKAASRPPLVLLEAVASTAAEDSAAAPVG